MARIPFKNGDEQDALTKWRKLYGPKAGVAAKVKRRYRRRERRTAKEELREDK